MTWETVIGLEIHVQLSTKSKLFSGGSTGFGAEPNTHVDLIDMGLPGVLPVANRDAFHKAIRFGLATNAEINQTSSFDRKNYFYPDLPKGYQITQMAMPIVGKGTIKIETEDGESGYGEVDAADEVGLGGSEEVSTGEGWFFDSKTGWYEVVVTSGDGSSCSQPYTLTIHADTK